MMLGWLLGGGGVLCLMAVDAGAHDEPHNEISKLTQRLVSAPNDAALRYKRGRLWLYEEHPAEALVDLTQVVVSAPDLPEALIDRALALHQLGRGAEALQDLGRYFQRAATPDVRAYEARALVKEHLGDLQGAVDDLRASLRLDPNPERAIKQATLLHAMGKGSEAIAGLEQQIAIMGSPVTLVLAVADMEAGAGRVEKALGWLAQLEAQPGRREPWLLRRAEILAKAGRMPEARAASQEALSLVEERIASGKASTYVQLQKAQALVGLGRAAEARELLQSLDATAASLAEYQAVQQQLGP
jgi:tetratricopeptide (TPR) repeat protein